MPTTPHSPPGVRRRGALRALPAAIAAPQHPVLCPWLAPCGPWLSYLLARQR